MKDNKWKDKINCSQLPKITAYIDNELENEEKEHLKKHLTEEECGDCQNRLVKSVQLNERLFKKSPRAELKEVYNTIKDQIEKRPYFKG